MGRVNKTIEGVFTNIIGTSKEISSYQQFINNGDKSKYSKIAEELTNDYSRLVNKHKSTFEQLASLEEIIMQIRIREDLDDIKFSLVREYIYARSPFYRNDKKSKDVRVIVDKVEFYPEAMEKGVDILMNNKDFVDKAKDKLGQVMDCEIEDGLLRVKPSLIPIMSKMLSELRNNK